MTNVLNRKSHRNLVLQLHQRQACLGLANINQHEQKINQLLYNLTKNNYTRCQSIMYNSVNNYTVYKKNIFTSSFNHFRQ